MIDLLMFHLVLSLAQCATNSDDSYVEAYDKKTTDTEDEEYTEAYISKQFKSGNDYADQEDEGLDPEVLHDPLL